MLDWCDFLCKLFILRLRFFSALLDGRPIMTVKSDITKSDSNGIVLSNKRIAETFYQLRLEFRQQAANAFAKAKPGQFAQIDVSKAALPPAEKMPDHLQDSANRKILLRRPFSFSDVTSEGDRTSVEILYCTIGPASLRMTTLSPGNSVSVIGPLGNGFRVPEGKKRAILVIGGMGAGPLIYLAKSLTNDLPDMDVIVFAGAKTATSLPFKKRLDGLSQELGFSLAEFAKFGVKSIVATDDGSAGYEGLVTDCVRQWLQNQ